MSAIGVISSTALLILIAIDIMIICLKNSLKSISLLESWQPSPSSDWEKVGQCRTSCFKHLHTHPSWSRIIGLTENRITNAFDHAVFLEVNFCIDQLVSGKDPQEYLERLQVISVNLPKYAQEGVGAWKQNLIQAGLRRNTLGLVQNILNLIRAFEGQLDQANNALKSIDASVEAVQVQAKFFLAELQKAIDANEEAWTVVGIIKTDEEVASGTESSTADVLSDAEGPTEGSR
jgi:hypothetical protein